MYTERKDFCDNCTKTEELSTQYRTLLSSISHEIRNPLTLIYSSVQLMEKEHPYITDYCLWPQLKQDIQDTLHLLKELSQLHGDTVSKTPICIVPFLKSIFSSFQPLMQEKHISFTTEIHTLPGTLTLYGNETKIKEALTNLLINACDALSTCDFPGEIHCSAAIQDFHLAIHIRDNGPGIPDTHLSSIFEPFKTYKSGGTGLGLCIAKDAALQHGGALTVETSTEGITFTDFCFTLSLQT